MTILISYLFHIFPTFFLKISNEYYEMNDIHGAYQIDVTQYGNIFDLGVRLSIPRYICPMIALRGQPAGSHAPKVLDYSRCVVLGSGSALLGTALQIFSW